MHTVTMNDGELFKAAVRHMAEAIEMLLGRNNLTTKDITGFVPHPANIRIVHRTTMQ